ncbi:unnamed protein product [Lactuca saligna]|uniref:Uncharacterized protein n=1 Tax=Lactuca saligna TaxID=75948 RepID=A0AA35YMR9_LACSI|nr:unnamed protein product [Lactuca saligna]
MSTQSEAPSTTPSVQVVGNAFVEQYYHILHHSPDMVHKFYQESSFVSRPDEDGVMITVTTMKGINEKICSLDYTAYKAEIKTADTQESYKDGVIVLVTGCLIRKEDNQRKKFIQSFFLAPQDKGYFVFNDVFRYVDEIKSLDDNNHLVVVEGIDDNQTLPLIQDPPSQALDISIDKEVQNIVEETQSQSQSKDVVEIENNEIKSQSQIHPPIIEESISSIIPVEDAPKMSYASILSSQMKRNNKAYVPSNNNNNNNNTLRATPTKIENKIVADVAQSHPHPSEVSTPTPPVASSSISSPRSHDDGDGYSVYVRNLPLNATVTQLEIEFNKFGPIKPGGIQVRSNKLGFCFGFIEFQDFTSMQNAIQNSPVVIGDREAVVEIKRTTTRVGAGRGRFLAGRGGFRGDTFRGRGSGSFNGGGGRGYGRSDYGGGRGEFSGRGRGGRGGEGYQQGGRRGGRRGGSAQYVSTN